MQEKYIPLYKDLYAMFESQDARGYHLTCEKLAVDIAQDILDAMTITPLSAPALITACKFVIKVVSETPAIASEELDELTDAMLDMVAFSSTVYSAARRNKSFEEMIK